VIDSLALFVGITSPGHRSPARWQERVRLKE
jgi:hypothetical protein